MNIKGVFESSAATIRIIPILILNVSMPTFIDMDKIWHYNSLTIGFLWLTITAAFEINFKE